MVMTVFCFLFFVFGLFCWSFFGIVNFFRQLTYCFPNTSDSKDHASYCPVVSSRAYVKSLQHMLKQGLFLGPLVYLIGLISMLQ